MTAPDPDVAAVQTALIALRDLALSHRYGGLGRHYTSVSGALAALDRIQTRLKPHQLPLALFHSETDIVS